jgi:hypothetical protein
MQLAGSLPGSTVVLNVNGSTVSGVVSGAAIENSTLFVTIDGKQFPASDLVSVTQSQAQALAGNPATSSTGTPSTTSSGTTTPTTPATPSS